MGQRPPAPLFSQIRQPGQADVPVIGVIGAADVPGHQAAAVERRANVSLGRVRWIGAFIVEDPDFNPLHRIDPFSTTAAVDQPITHVIW